MQKELAKTRSICARTWILRATQRLATAELCFGHGTGDPSGEAFWIAAHALKCNFDYLAGFPQTRLTVEQRHVADQALERRVATHKPLAYILGEAWLTGVRFLVDERVIVPRSFIAETIDSALPTWLPHRVATVLDLCTGSGCLAILLARHFRRAQVDGVDLSDDALAVARLNVRMHRLSRRVHPIRSDLFLSLGKKRYDLIVSNPPYVKDSSMRRLPSEYRHEPKLALAGGKDGLDLVRRILRDAPTHLEAEGVLVCEIGHNRKALEEAYPTLPFIWLSTEFGSDEVFLINREGLIKQASPSR